MADPWLQNINEEGYLDRMREIQLKIRSVSIRTINVDIGLIAGKMNTKAGSSNNENEITYFNENAKTKKLPAEKSELKYYIKIKGDIKAYKFMDILVKSIEAKNECKIISTKDKLKFNVIFSKKTEINEENEKNEENEEIENNLDEDECIMKIKLYETGKNEYLIHFIKLGGSLEEFYEHFLDIQNIIKGD